MIDIEHKKNIGLHKKQRNRGNVSMSVERPGNTL